MKIEDIEKYGLNNLTKILLYSGIGIIILFLWQQIFCIINIFHNTGYTPKTIDLTTTITILGAIFAFWYGYKKYERNKELEIIKLFKIIETDNLNFNEWEILFNLNKQGKIPIYLYEIIENKYTNYFYDKLFYKNNGKLIKNKIFWSDFNLNNIYNKTNFKKSIIDKIKHIKSSEKDKKQIIFLDEILDILK